MASVQRASDKEKEDAAELAEIEGTGNVFLLLKSIFLTQTIYPALGAAKPASSDPNFNKVTPANGPDCPLPPFQRP